MTGLLPHTQDSAIVISKAHPSLQHEMEVVPAFDAVKCNQQDVLSQSIAALRGLSYHAKTLYLFTCDQILDTVIPGTAFAICAAISGPVLDLPTQSVFAVLLRIPAVALWLWLVILQFCLQNQRNPGSVTEDAVNKSWRPIPSGRITRTGANRVLNVTHVLAGIASYHLGVLHIFGVYILLITGYNDFGGGDYNGVVRNLFCGAGFSCYFGGALSIALGSDIQMSSQAWRWTLLITFGTLATTIQTQEFRDEAGDRARGRRTLVTDLGRRNALWTAVITVLFWSLYMPFVFFRADWRAAALPVVLGGTLIATVARAMGEHGQKSDRRLYKLWCLWMFGFCPLPLLQDFFL